MDVTENLQSLKYGYHFYAHFGGSGNTDNYHTFVSFGDGAIILTETEIKTASTLRLGRMTLI